jgi:hypothetical protein
MFDITIRLANILDSEQIPSASLNIQAAFLS